MAIFGGVPMGMRDRGDCWINWQAEPRIDGKIIKIPKYVNDVGETYNASTSPEQHHQWTEFEDACFNSARSDGELGIGIVFHKGDNLVGFDFDNCFVDGALREDVADIVERLDSYTELSPSGKGLHVYIEGELKGGGKCNTKLGIEVYDHGRYFTVTGQPWGVTKKLRRASDETQAEIEAIYDQYYRSAEGDYTPEDLNLDPNEEVLELDELENLSSNCIALIKDGADGADRSEAIYGCAHKLLQAGANASTLVSILSNRDNGISEVIYEKHNPIAWLKKYIVGKAVATHVYADTRAFDDLPDLEEELTDEPKGTGEGNVTRNFLDVKPIKQMAEDFTVNGQIFRKCHPVLVYKEKYYAYRGDCWVEISFPILESMITYAMLGSGQKMTVTDNTIKFVRRTAVVHKFTPDKNRLAFRNGTVDVSGWDGVGKFAPKLMHHKPVDHITSLLEYEYDPDATAPKWEKFLQETFEGDQERIDLLQEHFGHLLVWDQKYQKILVMTGASRSGKGVICKILRRMVGELAYSGMNLDPLASQFGLEPLINAKVCVVEDAHSVSKNKIERVKEILLNVSSGDVVSVDRKRIIGLSQVIPARLVLVANRVPTFMDEYDALLNRYNVVTFERSVAGHEDFDLEDKLYGELPGIFNWAIAGLQRLGKNRSFTQSQRGEAMKLRIQTRQNPMGAFFKEHLVADEFSTETTKDIQYAYSQFCANLDRPPESDRALGLRLKSAGFVKARLRRDQAEGRPWGYQGVKLKPVRDERIDDFDDLDE